MQPTEKFRGDIDATLRRLAAQPEGVRLEALRGLFVRSFSGLPADLLASLFATFLEKWRAVPGRAVAWLGAVGSILLMDYDGTPLDAGEWAELRDSLNLESGDLELELLSYAMGLVLEHGAI